MFGKDAPPCELVSEDEDWGPGKRKRREKESDAVNTLMTMHESENKNPNNENSDGIREGSSGKPIRRSCFRIPHDALEVLLVAILFVIFLYSCCFSIFQLRKYINNYVCTNLFPLNVFEMHCGRSFAKFLRRMSFLQDL